ncbi:integrase core domain-containing protein, partial [Mycolicibacterium vinylchloridicum]|uniref:integrase core domain-containing protein n=1 Tax=Mycolicibacterium vinylchloridicum TaxID=2736928 RepID=UPI0015C93E43
HVGALGVEAITGKPYKPTTQGKNERFHQTLFRYLDKQPLAETLEQLQAQVDTFDHIYNSERPHQGLPGRITPLTAWEATPKAQAPRPRPDRPLFDRPEPRTDPKPSVPLNLPANTHIRTVGTSGTVSFNSIRYKVNTHLAFEQVLVVTAGDTIIITDFHGEVLAEHPRPKPGINYIGNGRPSGPQPKTDGTSPKS